MRTVQGLGATRAGLITNDAVMVAGNTAFDGAAGVKDCKRFARKVGAQPKSSFANDIVTLPWDGQAEFGSLAAVCGGWVH